MIKVDHVHEDAAYEPWMDDRAAVVDHLLSSHDFEQELADKLPDPDLRQKHYEEHI